MKHFYKASILILAIIVLACAKKQDANENKIAVDSTVQEQNIALLQVKIDARKIGPDKSLEQLDIEKAITLMEENKDLPIVGYWVGAFGRNKINIALAGISEGKAIGYTVCAGNYRPISGEVSVKGDSLYSFDMKEPGTDQYDGHFQFAINTNQNSLTGKWSPFKKGAASSKEFSLKKVSYEYRTDTGYYPESSERLLTHEDVENLIVEELEVMRNEIYARHGYSFKDKEMRLRFDTTTWYIPMGIDIRDKLTDIEVQNIDLIYQYEEYLEENYDDYGR
jgi:YARHG domain